MSYRGSFKITVVSVGLSVHQFNFYFCPNLSKKGTKWSQNSVLRIFWKILSLVFIGNNLKWKLILLLIFHCQSHIWQNSGSPVIGQNAFSQLQDSLKFNISRKKWTINFTFGMQISIEVFHKLIPSVWLCVTRHVQSPQNKFAYLFNISRITWWMKLMFFACR